jgi:hypothetical protein
MAGIQLSMDIIIVIDTANKVRNPTGGGSVLPRYVFGIPFRHLSLVRCTLDVISTLWVLHNAIIDK